MADIFMSYSRNDRQRAELLANVLSTRGWSVWWDRKIAAGATFDKKIEQELDAATCVLVLWSQASVDSEWVKNEAAAALEREALIPVLIENVRLPIEFRRRQTIDLVDWDGDVANPALQSLIEGIAQRLGGAPSKSPEERTSHAIPVRRRRASVLWLGAAGTLVAVVAGVVALKTRAPADRDSTAIKPAAAAPATTAPPSNAITYAMTCRAGGPFEMRNEPTGGVRVGFTPSDKPASRSMLPGQCSWSDRPINDQEPHDICDATEGRSQFVEALAREDFITVYVHHESATNCFRVVRF